jgi:hypothetical protein
MSCCTEQCYRPKELFEQGRGLLPEKQNRCECVWLGRSVSCQDINSFGVLGMALGGFSILMFIFAIATASDHKPSTSPLYCAALGFAVGGLAVASAFLNVLTLPKIEQRSVDPNPTDSLELPNRNECTKDKTLEINVV